MAHAREITRAEREILLEGLDDYVGIWEILSVVSRELSGSANGEGSLRRAVMEVVSDVLGGGLMRAGFPRDGGFEALDCRAGETVEWIEHEWDELDREPDVGDIIWFKLTDKGETRAKGLPESA